MRFYTEQHRFYCGVDLHARTMYLCILDQARWVVRTSFWGAEVIRLRSVGRETARTPDPANVFGAASRGRLGWNVAGAADA